MRAFCERAGRVLSREVLLELTQGRNCGSFDRSIDVLVSRIRRKIEADPADALMIKTVRSGGYMFTPVVEPIADGAGVEPRMKLLDVVIPKRISGQIAAIVVISIIVINAILATAFFLNRPDEQQRDLRPEPGQLTALIQMLGGAPKEERADLIAMMTRTFPQFEIRPAAPNEKFVSASDDRRDRPPPLHLSRDYRVLMPEGPPNGRLAVMLPDGEIVALRGPDFRGPPPFWRGPGAMMLLFVLVSLSLLGLWAARALSAPLSALAKAAETFSLDNATAPLPERGPEEIRSVARALNAMRQRITTLVDDRTKMLAAISHDLRTPITRMRLRTEFIDDETSRNQMLRDLDQMRAMLDSVLTFLRNDGQLEPMTPTDIATSLQSIADQFADIGHQVSYRGPAHATVNARPGDLHRAVTNLVDNAVRVRRRGHDQAERSRRRR